MKPYILWLNYGTEGWRPRDFDTAEEAIATIMAGESHGNELILTKILWIVAKEAILP